MWAACLGLQEGASCLVTATLGVQDPGMGGWLLQLFSLLCHSEQQRIELSIFFCAKAASALQQWQPAGWDHEPRALLQDVARCLQLRRRVCTNQLPLNIRTVSTMGAFPRSTVFVNWLCFSSVGLWSIAVVLDALSDDFYTSLNIGCTTSLLDNHEKVVLNLCLKLYF